MLNMKSYFRHQLKSYSRPLLVIVAAALVFGFFICTLGMEPHTRYYCEELGVYLSGSIEKGPAGVEYYETYGHYVDHDVPADQDPLKQYRHETDYGTRYRIPLTALTKHVYAPILLGYPATVLGILSFAVPIWMFAFLKKKRNLDCCYSLPISRVSLGMAQYLVGLLLVLIPFCAAYLQNILINLLKGYFFNLGLNYLLVHFLFCILMGTVIYSVFCFAFNLANSASDGVIFLLVSNVLPYYLLAMVLELYAKFYRKFIVVPKLHTTIYYDIEASLALPWRFFGKILSEYENAVDCKHANNVAEIWESVQTYIWLVIWILAAVFCVFGVVYIFRTRPTEKTEEISDTILGYKLFIPLCSFLLMLLLAGEGVILGIFITGAAALGYTIYRRGVRYAKSDLVIMLILFVMAFVLGGMDIWRYDYY